MRPLFPVLLSLALLASCSTKVTGRRGDPEPEADEDGTSMGGADNQSHSPGGGDQSGRQDDPTTPDRSGGAGGATASGGTTANPEIGMGGQPQTPEYECEPGTQRSAECGMCGGTIEFCSTDGSWEGSGQCFEEGTCARGTQESGASCGACGVLERTCLADCEWGGWYCVDEGECEAGTTNREEEACEACGLSRSRNRTCSDDCSWSDWSDWSTCAEAPCELGDVETEEIACGNCGTASRSRTCDGCGYSPFGSFGQCQNEGPCQPGDVEHSATSCGWCGTRATTRTCGEDCEWEEWTSAGECQGQGDCDPNSAPQQLERSCGNCGSGTQTATATCSPSCELQVGAWSTCSGSSGCAPGDTKANTVAACGPGQVWLHSECNTSCQWEVVSNCCSTNGDCNCTSSGCN